ncbi:MAG: hypothetical protein LN413_02860 [Candidatus Thermoplasmatota archaeon]|nr:hypothetical protein [Candidatus Thermoplasmatota archaeon]
MEEHVVVFDLENAPPKQRVNHAHIHGELIELHSHPLEKERGGVEGAILARRDFLLIMTVNYQKQADTLEFEAGPGTTVTSADVGLGSVVFKFQVGKKKAKEEVSVLSLRQLDSRVRRRVRDARKATPS